ncbi:metalloregulator ArsR/SmtB family transcription factor [bacterium]|nr:metalloregulator ArsR/SmtB family transcription factor [bacterium]
MAVKDVTRLFKTLSDPTRLRLTRLLDAGELSVMELSEATQLAQSRVSNHLKVLREEGIVQERREGPWRHYRIDVDRLPEAVAPLWQSIRAAWDGDELFLADLARMEGVIARREKRNGRFFERIADEWDEIRSALFGDSIGRALLRAFVPRDLTVADIGSGTGHVIELFADRPRKIIAIDNSEAMFSVARRKVEAWGLDNVEFRQGDAHEPPLKPGEVNIATLVMVLQHLDEPGRAVRSAAKALAPGGLLYLADFMQHQETWLRDHMQHRWLGFSREQLDSWMNECGLEIDGWVALPGKPWTTPDNKKVQVPDGFALLARKPDE